MQDLIDYTLDLLEPLGVEAYEVKGEGDTITVTPRSDKVAAAVIGKDGATVKALQRLVRVAGYALYQKRFRLVVDQSEAK